MFGQDDDLQKLVVLNNNVVMQLVQFVGSLQAVQSGTVDAMDSLTHGDKEQAIGLLTQAKEELTEVCGIREARGIVYAAPAKPGPCQLRAGVGPV